jgi:hypothetical protein
MVPEDLRPSQEIQDFDFFGRERELWVSSSGVRKLVESLEEADEWAGSFVSWGVEGSEAREEVGVCGGTEELWMRKVWGRGEEESCCLSRFETKTEAKRRMAGCDQRGDMGGCNKEDK